MLVLLIDSVKFEDLTESNEHIYPATKRCYTYKINGVSKIQASFIPFLQNLHLDLCISVSDAES